MYNYLPICIISFSIYLYECIFSMNCFKIAGPIVNGIVNCISWRCVDSKRTVVLIADADTCDRF